MNLLIIKSSALGDIIHAFPVLHYLRQKFPEANIDWVVEAPYAELLEAHPGVNRVHRIDTKRWRKGKGLRDIFRFRKELRTVVYDVLFDLQGNSKSAWVTSQAKAKHKVGFGKTTVPEWPNLLVTNQKYNPSSNKNIREDYLFLAQQYFQDNEPFVDHGVTLEIDAEGQNWINETLTSSARPLYLVCPGSRWRNKQMSLEGLTQFLTSIQEDTSCFFLFSWGSPTEKEEVKQLHQAFPQTSRILDRVPLPILQNLMAQVDQVIAMDSLPLHLAGTTATPTISVFGPSSSEKYRPLGEQHRSFQGACPYGVTFHKRCSKLRTCSSGACIRSLNGTELKQRISLVKFAEKN